MTNPRQIFEFTFPSGADWGLMSLSLGASELAERAGCTLEDWEEDGLGPAQGFGFRLDSGSAFLVKQLLLSEKQYSTIYIDAKEAGELGAVAFREQIVSALKSDLSEIDWWPEDVNEWAALATDLAGQASRHLHEKLAKAGGKETDG